MHSIFPTAKDLAELFDHTQLRPYAQEKDFVTLCDESKRFGFKMVAINSVQTAFCKQLLRDTPIHVGAAISFPLGQTTIAVKRRETEQAIQEGADEIDYVIHIGKLKDRDYAYIQKEMEEIVTACRQAGVISKVIFENCFLTQEEKLALCGIANQVGPDFIKTSTGFGTGGATVEDVRLMRENADERILVKAAGGIRTLADAAAMYQAGARRIGSTASVKIMEEYLSMLAKEGMPK